MKLRKYFTILLVFVLTLSFAVPSFASGGRPESSGNNYYGKTDLENQAYIDAWNDMSVSEQNQLVKSYFPIILGLLGIVNGHNVSYDQMNTLYMNKLNSYKLRYNDDPVSFLDSGLPKSVTDFFVNGTVWYKDFADFLVDHIELNDGKLDFNGIDSLNVFINEVVSEEQADNGVITLTLQSVYKLTTSSFPNGASYSYFVEFLRQQEEPKFLIIGVNRYTNNVNVGVPKNPSNCFIFNNGTDLSFSQSEHITFVDRYGNFLKSNDFIWTGIDRHGINVNYPSGWNYLEILNDESRSFDYGFHNYGTNLNPEDCWEYSFSSGVWFNANYGIYTYNSSNTSYNLFTTLDGFNNSNGYFEPTFIKGSNFGSIPSVSVTAGDVTQFVNVNVDVDVPGGGGSGSGGGSDSDNDDDESLWDKIKDGVVGFFEELAEVIKEVVSLIVNVLLGALRELIGAVKDILNEMVDFFIGEKDPDNPGKRLDNGFVSLMTAFFDWLPAPLPLVIKSIFIIAIVFALIKMVKGFAS